MDLKSRMKAGLKKGFKKAVAGTKKTYRGAKAVSKTTYRGAKKVSKAIEKTMDNYDRNYGGLRGTRKTPAKRKYDSVNRRAEAQKKAQAKYNSSVTNSRAGKTPTRIVNGQKYYYSTKTRQWEKDRFSKAATPKRVAASTKKIAIGKVNGKIIYENANKVHTSYGGTKKTPYKRIAPARKVAYVITRPNRFTGGMGRFETKPIDLRQRKEVTDELKKMFGTNWKIRIK